MKFVRIFVAPSAISSQTRARMTAVHTPHFLISDSRMSIRGSGMYRAQLSLDRGDDVGLHIPQKLVAADGNRLRQRSDVLESPRPPPGREVTKGSLLRGQMQ